MFLYSDSLSTLIDALNEVVFLNDNPSDDSVNELTAAVHANSILTNDGLFFGENDSIVINTKMFFKHYDRLSFKSDIMKIVNNRINFLISKPGY